uniref:Uncharacterized protein n=1 Tax=Macrostomum lignano TaxID=282301 RepID=A0A1I8IHD3_9PLAT
MWCCSTMPPSIRLAYRWTSARPHRVQTMTSPGIGAPTAGRTPTRLTNFLP